MSLYDVSINFRVIRLQNGLTALLIADVYSKTSAAEDEDDEEGNYQKDILIKKMAQSVDNV